MRKLLLVCLFLSSFTIVVGQNVSNQSKLNVGFGIGIDYGGLPGCKIDVCPTKNFAVFGAFGYNIIGLGYNFGATVRISPEKNICPTISAMYGYNAVIKVDGYGSFSKVYFGPTFAFGLEFNSNRKGFWNVELLLPIRSEAYNDKINELENDPTFEFKSKPMPIGISIGYHIWL